MKREREKERDYQLVESFVPVSILFQCYLIFHETGKEITQSRFKCICIYNSKTVVTFFHRVSFPISIILLSKRNIIHR